MKFKGQSYISIKGDCHTPSRMWDITLCTESEFTKMPEIKKSEFRKINESDRGLLELHFGR